MSTNIFSQTSDKTYILVHGAWHGAWCWYKVVPLLEAKGHKVIAIDLPGHGKDTTNPTNITLDDYVNKVVAVANEQTGQVILVGHSSGGVVISQAAEELGLHKIATLVYLDAFIPKDGESVFSLVAMVQKQLPPAASKPLTIMDCITPSEDKKTSVFKPELAQEFFYDDCSAEDIKFAKANLSRQAFASLAIPVKVTDSIYGTIPKYYILCIKSKDLDKTLLSTHVPCKKVYTLPSSHSAFFSMPEKLADILNEVY